MNTSILTVVRPAQREPTRQPDHSVPYDPLTPKKSFTMLSALASMLHQPSCQTTAPPWNPSPSLRAELSPKTLSASWNRLL
jgi:hypothetical protein